MATCPAGHASTADDYCDVCGIAIAGRSTSAATEPSMAPSPVVEPASEAPCPDCGAPRTGRFCEACGYDFATGGGKPTAPPQPAAAPPPQPAPPPPPQPVPTTPPATWTAVVTADRAYYERVVAHGGPDAKSITFPPYCPERRIPLAGAEIRVGRRSPSRGIFPEIDLSGPPEDPGVSRLHAVLLAKPDDGWVVVDPGSTNGVTINDADEPIEVNVEVPVAEGDRICLGAWTTITLRRG